MVDLLLHILFSSAFVLIIKWVQNRRREDLNVVGPINYIVATILIAPESISRSEPLTSPVILFGVSLGICYFSAYFLVVRVIERIGASSASVISALSILVPIMAAAMIWNERPNLAQVIGIGVAITSLMLVGGKGPSESTAPRKGAAIGIMIGFFVLAGGARLSQEAFRHVAEEAQRPNFLFCAFIAAAIPSVVILLARRKRFTRREVYFGAAIGAANILQTYFMIRAVKQLEGYIVFPLASAGGLVVTALCANRWLGEKLSKRTLTGITLAILALVLLCFFGR